MFVPVALSQAFVVVWLCYLVFVFWAVYTCVAAYHWLTYSHGSLIAVPSNMLHLGVSFILIIYVLTGTLGL